MDEINKFINFVLNYPIQEVRGEAVGRDTVDLKTCKVIVDTCFTEDIEQYETGVCVHSNVYIMERYSNREEAIKGHNKWLEMAEKERLLAFFDPQMNVIRVIE